MIALAGAGIGAAAAWYGSGMPLQFFRDPMMFSGMSLRPDNTVFLTIGAFAVLTTLFFGIAPAWRAGRSDPGSLLKSRTAAAQRQLAGRAFVPIQVSLSLVLVALASLLSQSLIRLRGENTGFDVNHVTIQTSPFNRLPQQGDAKLDLYQRMVDRIEQSPGVQSAAVTWYTPMTGTQATARFEASTEGSSRPEEVCMAYNAVGPGYFRTMKTRVLEGREFEKNERDRTVCALNQPAVGRYVRSNDREQFPEGVACRVVGLAEDAKFGSLREPPPRTVYFPVARDTVAAVGNLVFPINAPTKAQAITGYREALRAIAPSVPLVLFATLREQMDAALGSQRAITMPSTFFGGVALFLSAIGLYGVLSAGVVQRTGEIGVRVALGAQRGARMLLGAIGLYFAVRSVKHLLYGVSAFDPTTLAATAALPAMAALVAAAAPAMRAASVNPIRALRAE